MGAARVIVVICISIDVRLIQDDLYNVCMCVCVCVFSPGSLNL